MPIFYTYSTNIFGKKVEKKMTTKLKASLLALILLPSVLLFAGCTVFGIDFGGEGDGEITEPTQNIFLSNYVVPENFTITFGSDAEHRATTTKVGNDWYTVTYTDDEYFFDYVEDNKYNEYKVVDETWALQGEVNFEEMVSSLSHDNYQYNFYPILIFDDVATLSATDTLTVGTTTYTVNRYYKELNLSSTFQSDTYYMHQTYTNICLKYTLYVDGFTYNYTATNFSTTVDSFSGAGITIPSGV